MSAANVSFTSTKPVTRVQNPLRAKIQNRKFRTANSGPRIQDCGRGTMKRNHDGGTCEARTVAAETVKLE